jgi:hypothetical protein
MPVHIMSVNQTKNLSKHVWVDSDHISYTWEEALLNPGLATAIMQRQLQHHITLHTIAINTMVHHSTPTHLCILLGSHMQLHTQLALKANAD